MHPNVFHDVLDLIPVTGWQIVQQADGLRVLVNGVREGFQDETIIRILQDALRSQGIIVPCVKVERVATIPRGAVKAVLIRPERSWGR